MTKFTTSALALAAILALTACGGGGSDEPQATSANTGTGYYLDSAVEGIDYACGSQSGKTDKDGKFTFEEGKKCQFTLAGIPVKSIAADELHDGVKIVEDDVKVARFLQSIDADGDPSNGITITDEVLEALQKAVDDLQDSGDIQDTKEVIENNTTLATVVTEIQNNTTDFKGNVVTEDQAKEHLAKTQTEVTKELLKGKTLYLVDDQKVIVTVSFNQDLTTLTFTNPNDTQPNVYNITINGNTITDREGDHIIDQVTKTYIKGHDKYGEWKFYFNKSDAEAYLKSLTSGENATSGDLSWIVGKTLYECDGESLTFQDNGRIKLVENDGTEQYIPYSIEGNTIYTKESNEQESHSLIEKTDTYVKFKDGDKDTSTFYFNRENAKNAPADECGHGSDDEGSDEYKISDLVSGHITLVDEDNTVLPIPSDAWIRITPSIYQVENAWYGVNCKIDSNGNFGTQCYIHKNESDMHSAFSNSNEKFQIIVYAERTGTTHWEKDEPTYGWSRGDVSYGAWQNLKISKVPLN